MTYFKLIGVSGLIVIFLGLAMNGGSGPQEQIVGTWIPEDGSSSSRWVIEESGTVTRYNKNSIYKTYNWTIEEGQTPSGITIHHLVLTNTLDADDVYKYTIDTLNENRLILVYNNGLSLQRNTYIRQ